MQISGKVFYKSSLSFRLHFGLITTTSVICTNILRDLRISEGESVVLTFPFQSHFHLSGTAVKTGWGCDRTLSTISHLCLPACMFVSRSDSPSVGIASQFSPGSEGKSVYPRTTLRLSCTAWLFQSCVEAPAWQRLIKWRFTRGQSEGQFLTL